MDGMVRIPSHESLRMTSALTLSAWVKPDVQNGIGIILNKEGEYEVVIFPDNTVRFALANQSPGWIWINTGFTISETNVKKITMKGPALRSRNQN